MHHCSNSPHMRLFLNVLAALPFFHGIWPPSPSLPPSPLAGILEFKLAYEWLHCCFLPISVPLLKWPHLKSLPAAPTVSVTCLRWQWQSQMWETWPSKSRVWVPAVSKLEVLMRKRRRSMLESWPKQLTSERVVWTGSANCRNALGMFSSFIYCTGNMLSKMFDW